MNNTNIKVEKELEDLLVQYQIIRSSLEKSIKELIECAKIFEDDSYCENSKSEHGKKDYSFEEEDARA